MARRELHGSPNRMTENAEVLKSDVTPHGRHSAEHNHLGAAARCREGFRDRLRRNSQMDKSSHFDHLLRAAAADLEPQRLLFVFATAELPDDATPEQRRRFAAGGGGTLKPVMCVDKGLDDLASFEELVAESSEAGPHGAWSSRPASRDETASRRVPSTLSARCSCWGS